MTFDITPRLHSLLSEITNLEQPILFHELQHIRHPLAMYNNSINQILDLLDTFFTKYEAINQDYISHFQQYDQTMDIQSLGVKHHQYNELLDSFEKLLYKTNSFFDEMYKVLLSFCPEVKPDNIPEYKFLEKMKFPGIRDFNKKIVERRKKTAHIVNHLKHHGNYLREIHCLPKNLATEQLEWYHFVRSGYVLEVPSENGSLGADPTLHPGRFANSFYKDILDIVFQLYYISDLLHDLLITFIQSQYSLQMIPIPAINKKWGTTIQKIVKFPPLIFPHESFKPHKTIHLKDDQLIFYKVNKEDFSYNGELLVTATMHGDGVTKTFELPYIA